MGGKTFKVGGRFGYQNTNAQYADMCTTKRREIPRTTFLQALIPAGTKWEDLPDDRSIRLWSIERGV